MALPVNGSTHLIPAYYSFYRPRKDERLSWPSWLTCSGWLTQISGHPSVAGRAQDRESSPARDRRSTTVPRHQLSVTYERKNIRHHRHHSHRLSTKLKYKGSPYSITKPRVPKLIPVLGSQHASDGSHKPGGRLPLVSARPAVTPATLKRAATSFAAL